MTSDVGNSDPTPPPSLASRLGGWVRDRRRGLAMADRDVPQVPGRRWAMPVLAGLIAAGPFATLLGATVLAGAVERETRRMEALRAPRRIAEARREAAHVALSGAMMRPGPAALLDGVAAALPADAALVRAERSVDGALALEVSVSDPDALRSAVRRVPALAGLRDVRQQEGEGRTMVLLRQVAP
ncbi:hypothetical protein CA233_00475 [Sphingomonas sp. ABOLD]|uniref:Uncharacterized protein n=1 Tax=Sphingomonas trueperi TaxID=53317 RepID=A0A7X5Y1E4_9SPHN|nr:MULTISPECIES: hypothetical protein [Sphingomonas]NJB97686.1 hypothetical protein [Sphingomonas trueperi]RSV43505.1 hypothetical protein CA234_04690 [Sphingomonas sp. ABOLE]RSV52886.1 hypothetical protein CA233_00475 [Sphingomonas sp. ABOLD]